MNTLKENADKNEKRVLSLQNDIQSLKKKNEQLDENLKQTQQTLNVTSEAFASQNQELEKLRISLTEQKEINATLTNNLNSAKKEKDTHKDVALSQLNASLNSIQNQLQAEKTAHYEIKRELVGEQQNSAHLKVTFIPSCPLLFVRLN